MNLDISVKNHEKPLPEATIILSSNHLTFRTPGPTAHFAGLEPDIYALKVEAKDHYPQTLTIGLEKSSRLAVMLKERR